MERITDYCYDFYDDVLGLIAPINLQPKLLHQEIYRKKFD